MTSEVALRVGIAVAQHFGNHGRVVVGKDTRLSGYMFETALASGLCAAGADVMLVGPLPTPAIAYITRSMRADAGVVISASHNPFEDNGIKLFAQDGFKLDDDIELELEGLIEMPLNSDLLVRGAAIGKAVRIDDAAGRYVTHLKQAFPDELSLDGIRIVVDCGHGAAYRVAPAVFEELGATVIAMGVRPDGRNINEGCGALHPSSMAAAVLEHGADLGIALDGDADRVIFADARGQVVDGDAILALCAIDLAARGRLRARSLAATVMSNLGLLHAMERHNITVYQTAVGDRYVVEAMRKHDISLGGEPSGHLVFRDHSTTGDGLLAALQVLAAMARGEQDLASLAAVVSLCPQVLRSVSVPRRVPLVELPRLGAAVRACESELGGEGRVLVRWSGTEAKLRIMVEGPDAAVLDRMVEYLESTLVAEIAT